MGLKTKLIITWMFTIILFVMCSDYIMKYQETNRELEAAKVDLQIAQDGLAAQIENNIFLQNSLEQDNQTLQDLKSSEYEFVYLGAYKLTYYCDERYNHICGGSGITASGRPTTVGSTIGVNPKEIPYGSMVYIEGLGFRSADDTGSGIGTKHIDVLVSGHQEALSQTLLKSDVWVLVKK